VSTHAAACALPLLVLVADGHVVQGLTVRDFQILDRGRPQRIAAFEETTVQREIGFVVR
jgi:hypothetical protein